MLWLARCGLTDLDGIGSFLALKVGLRCPGLGGGGPREAPAEVPVLPQELYVSYNNIADLSPLCLLDQLEVLDLEGNNVEDLGQLRYLQLCPRLATLTLEGNLVCLQPSPSTKVCVVGTQPAVRRGVGGALWLWSVPPPPPRGLGATAPYGLFTELEAWQLPVYPPGPGPNPTAPRGTTCALYCLNIERCTHTHRPHPEPAGLCTPKLRTPLHCPGSRGHAPPALPATTPANPARALSSGQLHRPEGSTGP